MPRSPSSLLHHHRVRDHYEWAFWLTAPVATFFAFRLFARLLYIKPPKPVYRAPRRAVTSTAQEQTDDDWTPYPADALPGGCDLDSPYGTVRVYEWGPEDGRKVLFVHGISTPSVVFAPMAKMLVEEQGCRVLLFDLFGRGYSDAPDPRVYRQSIQLWTSQIMLVLASSELNWTGPEKFTLVGYSLGGGIGAAFTSFFPQLVRSLVLIAPGGIIRPHHISWGSKLIYGGLLPQVLANYLVSRRLGGHDLNRSTRGSSKPPPIDQEAAGPAKVMESEVPPHPALAKDSDALIFPDRPGISIARCVEWQLQTHPGFLPSFISSIQHAPIIDEQERWRTIGERQQRHRTSPSDSTSRESLEEGRVLVILGKTDSVVVANEVAEDATAVLGEDNVTVKIIDGQHDVGVVNARGCVDAMVEHWKPAEE